MPNKIFLPFCISFLLITSLSLSTQEKSLRKPTTPLLKNDSILYYDASRFTILGKYHNEPNYARLPEKYEEIVRPAVWRLSRSSSGISIIFTTNSPSISAKWSLINGTTGANMTSVVANGLDLYFLKEDDSWQFVNAAIPSGKENESTIISDMNTSRKTFLLNLPLYDGIENLSIGVPEGFSISKPVENPFSNKKPIVFYGTSITQGASASRPGMAFPALIERSLNMETINLGFSGNGKFEEAVGQALCEIDARLFVIDCVPNSPPDVINKNALPLIRQLHACRPNTPILLMESIMREYAYFKKSGPSEFGSYEFIQAQNDALRSAFNKAKNQGINNIFYLEDNYLIGADHEGTIDGTHFNDLGMYRMADHLEEKITNILGLQ